MERLFKGIIVFSVLFTTIYSEPTFLLRGYAHSGLEWDTHSSSFVGGSFNPIFLWKQSEKLLFESEIEMEYENNETNIFLEYANLSYLYNKYITLRFGKILVPFGIFSARLHPRWINRLPSAPLGFGHDGVGPSSDLGIEIRGAIPIRNIRFGYAVYTTNGPSLSDGSKNPVEAGKLKYSNIPDNNNNKAVGGRFSVLPFHTSSLEVGVSGQYATVGDDDAPAYDVNALFLSADLSFVKRVSFLRSVLDLKAQWNYAQVDDFNYVVTENDITTTLNFENTSQAYFGQISLRPIMAESKWLNNTEVVHRISGLNIAHDSPWGEESLQLAFGIKYWLDWRTVFKLAYQFGGAGGHGHGGTEEVVEEEGHEDEHAFFFHWAIGF
jgi:hypothetical protein